MNRTATTATAVSPGTKAGWVLSFEPGSAGERLTIARREESSEESGAGVALEHLTTDGWRRVSGGPSFTGQDIAVMKMKQGWRLLAPSSYTLTGIGAAVGDGVSSGWSLTSAHHSGIGALSPGSIDPAMLGVGDTLTLEYSPGAVTATQPWFCVLDTEQAPAATHRRGPATDPGAGPTPIQFALHPSQPNPSRGPSLIRFDLPQATDLKLEIFDVHGRRIYELARGRCFTALRPGLAQNRVDEDLPSRIVTANLFGLFRYCLPTSPTNR
jgi:hypothetical protein